MAGKCCGHTHAILFIISTQILLLAFVLLLLGTVYYIQDRPKERDYAESTCRVLAGSYRAKKYKRRDHYYPTWEVQHSGPRFINATIGSNGGYPTEEYAQKALQKMSVRIVAPTSPMRTLYLTMNYVRICIMHCLFCRSVGISPAGTKRASQP